MDKNNFTSWLRKIFKLNLKIFNLNFIALVVSVCTLLLTFEPFYISHKGDIEPILYFDQYIGEAPYQFIICHTSDSNIISNPQIAPKFKNNSDAPIRDISIKYTIDISNTSALDGNISKDFSLLGSYTDQYNISRKTFTYNTDILYPNQTTPDLFKNIYIPIKGNDSLFYKTSVKAEIFWNGSKKKEYNSHIYTVQLADEFTNPDFKSNKLDSILFNRCNHYFERCCSFLKHKFTDNTNLLISYHSREDSTKINSKGIYIYLNDINQCDLDSIFVNRTPNYNFIRKHTPGFIESDYNQNKINWFNCILSGLLALAIIFSWFYLLKNKEIKSWKDLIALLSFTIIAVTAIVNATIAELNFIRSHFSIYIFGINVISAIILSFAIIILLHFFIKNNGKNFIQWIIACIILGFFVFIVVTFIKCAWQHYLVLSTF